MELENIQNIYFVGIGGIGMSALARYCKLQGKNVYGYDKTPTKLTKALISEGILVSFIDNSEDVVSLLLEKEVTQIVYTPAIPESNNILNFFISKGFSVVKRAKLLGEITRNTTCLAVAGTHGKTTTSAILGHLLVACNMPVTAFLGGIAENYNSNFISNGTSITVVEADEFDRSFLTLNPDIACITSMDADHLDIYETNHSIEDAFVEFSKLVPKKENVLYKKGLPLQGQSVAVLEPADFEAQNVRIENGGYVFDLKTPKTTLKDLQFYLHGHHNLSNAITALGMAILVGSPPNCLPKALSTFKGVQRRFSYKIKRNDLVLIDDYAHHPTEIDALYQAVAEMYPEDKKVIVFQPHLYTRTRDFIDGFAKSLSQFDEVLLLDIYPAREEPIEGVDSQLLLQKITAKKQLITKEEILPKLQSSSARIKLLVGAGDIGEEVSKISKKLSKNG
ncbi:UDP-N-acetylmuramate--L-alanine ligase [Patiriisocius hiemis]|uniref:UDP-N-acetylmuramate--L-alanine ligase n=1 Tax=Patiriisocius hiemis TaxID=3075604 RepID=A0ABU2YC38_9FLAO|nr:UDP-N-acetylmuramate--L-alanine ligase [Constantimarinum sp. W242]MDT0555754.1 UDP-N-acetylmuramate--L-alanine ligase [Constantimarinum sp. W242]